MTALALALLLLARPAAALEAAAGKVDITPDLASEKTYMAGFGATGRKPLGVHDPLHARLLVLREGDKTLALVSVDLLGLYRNDVQELRRLSGFDAPGRYLFAHATHQHSGPDTLGLWGPLPGVSGVNARYHARMKARIAEALKLLETQLRPVSLAAGTGALDPRGLCRDLRDPQVIDPHLSVLRVVGKDGKAVATVVNWSCHPEVLGRENRLITADFPGPLCERVEEKTGGACLFLNGMIGGLMSPDAWRDNFYESARVGRAVADAALALKTAPAAGPARLRWSAELLRVPVENSRYLLFLPALVFGHRLHDAAGRELPGRKAWSLALRHLFLTLPESARPWVETEVSVLDLGPARVLGMPAEVFPELAIGGYDGRHSYGRPTLSPRNPAPPDLKAAPKGPYLRELVRAPAPMLVGLANDELGYLVPGYDFKTSGTKSLTPRPPGHHYEETNSIGPSATRLLFEAAARLLKEKT